MCCAVFLQAWQSTAVLPAFSLVARERRVEEVFASKRGLTFVGSNRSLFKWLSGASATRRSHVLGVPRSEARGLRVRSERVGVRANHHE